MTYAEIGGPRAVQKVQQALKTGRLAKPERCEDCDATAKLQGHHHRGYDEAHLLDVVWLCRPCHQVRHGKRAAVPSWERGARAYAERTGRKVQPFKTHQWHGFGDWSMPNHLLKNLRALWLALRTEEERAAARALIAELDAANLETGDAA